MKLAQVTTLLAVGMGMGMGMGIGAMPYIPQPKEKKNDPERIALAEAKRNRKAANRLKLVKEQS